MKRILIFMIVFFGFQQMRANNIQIELMGKADEETNFPKLTFKVTWENSWRTQPTDEPKNWDAAWIFVKYIRSDEQPVNKWRHATIKAAVTAGSESEFMLPPSDRKGIMLYRKNPGTGTFTETVTLTWDKSADAVPGAATIVEFCGYAIEMVYVPQGDFYFNDKKIIGVEANGYPNGYRSFYCMKTEISQGQYASFLNKVFLDPAPTPTLLNKMTSPMSMTDRIYSGSVSNSVHRDACLLPSLIAEQEYNATIASIPATTYSPTLLPSKRNPSDWGFSITKNVNGIYVAGAPERACNFLTGYRVAAYLMWAGLRHMTDEEFQKACRGTLLPTQGEYAWGNTSVAPATGFVDAGTPSETYLQDNADANAHLYWNKNMERPGRAGAFAKGNTNRQQAGATYYGILDMTGNVSETVVPSNVHAKHYYKGTHGTGELQTLAISNPPSNDDVRLFMNFPTDWPYWWNGGQYYYCGLYALYYSHPGNANSYNYFNTSCCYVPRGGSFLSHNEDCLVTVRTPAGSGKVNETVYLRHPLGTIKEQAYITPYTHDNYGGLKTSETFLNITFGYTEKDGSSFVGSGYRNFSAAFGGRGIRTAE